MRATSAIKPFLFGFLVVAMLAGPAAAIQFSSARVSGNFVYVGGAPADNRQLHFQNRASGDMFVAPTDSKGEFSAYLPPGIYDLRAERGVILKSKVVVIGDDDMSIGTVVEPAPLDVRKPFERQSVVPPIVESAAPATANKAGRPMESFSKGHTLVQLLYGPAKPLPPIPEPQPALPSETAPSAAASPAAH